MKKCQFLSMVIAIAMTAIMCACGGGVLDEEEIIPVEEEPAKPAELIVKNTVNNNLSYAYQVVFYIRISSFEAIPGEYIAEFSITLSKTGTETLHVSTTPSGRTLNAAVGKKVKIEYNGIAIYTDQGLGSTKGVVIAPKVIEEIFKNDGKPIECVFNINQE